MTPVQFLARLASLVPPPRYPLVRFAGIFAPASTWRAAVVAMPRTATTTSAAPASPPRRRKRRARTDSAPPAHAASGDPSARGLHEHVAPPDLTPLPGDARVTADLPPPYSRIDWATLLRRVYLDDVLCCPCGGRRTVVADVSDRDAVVQHLARLGLDADPPPIARARDPTLYDVA